MSDSDIQRDKQTRTEKTWGGKQTLRNTRKEISKKKQELKLRLPAAAFIC